MRPMLATVAVVAMLSVAFVLGWVVGIDDGFDTGYRYAYREMENKLREGIQGGMKFAIDGLNVRFVPPRQKQVQLVIAGAGDEGMRKTWE